MWKVQDNRMSKKRKIRLNNSSYYTLADSCKLLGKARSTIMRLLPTWEKVTGAKPTKDHSGRWLIPCKSVHALRDNPSLYLRLAGRATKWEDKQRQLEADNKQLKKILKSLMSKHDLVPLKKVYPDLLGDI